VISDSGATTIIAGSVTLKNKGTLVASIGINYEGNFTIAVTEGEQELMGVPWEVFVESGPTDLNEVGTCASEASGDK